MIEGEPGGPKKALNGLFRCVDLGAFALDRDVRLGDGQALDDQGEAARRDEAFRARMLKARIFQALNHQTLEISRRLGLHTRRDFLGQQLEEKFGHRV